MQFIISYEVDLDHRNQAQDRFTSTGAPPPEGVTMHGRWHSVAGRKGWLLAETDNAEALMTWTQVWSDTITFEVTPVIGDEEAARVLSSD